MKTQYLPSLCSRCAVVLLFFFALPTLRAQDGVDWAIPPQFKDARSFSEGLAAVKKDKKWGFIDKTGKIVIPFEYDDVNAFSEGLALVRDNDKDFYGFIDKNGERKIKSSRKKNPQHSFHNGLALVTRWDKKKKESSYGFINYEGDIVIPCKYDWARDFSEGFAVVRDGNVYSYINKNGKIIYTASKGVWQNYRNFYDGLALVSEENGKHFYIDTIGRFVMPCLSPIQYQGYEEATSPNFSEGLAGFCEKGYKCGYIDNMGKVVIPPIFNRVYPFKEGMAIAYKNNNPCVIDYTGKVLFSLPNSDVYYISNGLYDYNILDGYRGKICFSEGLVAVSKLVGNSYRLCGFMDKMGKEAVPFAFEDVRPSSSGLIAVKYGTNYRKGEVGKWGYVKNPILAQATDSTKRIFTYRSRFALIIGNDAYKTMPPLANAINDSKAIEARLSSLGFEVFRIENADKATFQKKIGEFAEKLKDGGTGLFYYAGHGVQFDNKNYLVPTDADTTKRSCISADDILYAMENREVAVNILILDACRSNARGEKDKKRTFAKPDFDAKGSVIAFSTSPDNIALDGSPDCPRNSVYTCELLKNMKKGVKLEDVFKRTREGVIKQSQNYQIPWEHSSLIGEFEF